jgi:hypothetical protein
MPAALRGRRQFAWHDSAKSDTFCTAHLSARRTDDMPRAGCNCSIVKGFAMSVVDRPSRLAPQARAAVWNLGGQALDTIERLAGNAWIGFWSNRPLKLSIVWALVAWVVLEAAFLAWVHRNLEGVSHRAFLPGAAFTMPEREKAVGMKAVCKIGYDGQLYYWMSNDIFGRFDAVKALDEPLYRYQRIGVPMLAGTIATVLGFELTPPLLYHTLQFGMTAAGFGGLVYFLLVKGLNPAYALGWLISCGTLQSLWLGILDAPADAIFVFTILAVLAGRLWWYAPLATLLLLTREGYVAYAFAIFLVTAISRFAWQDKQGSWKRLASFAWKDVSGYWKPVVLTAIPGIVMLAWMAYLSIHFQMSPIKARGNPDATNWPYYMMSRYAKIFFRDGNWFELRLLLVSGFSLVLVSVLLAKNYRKLPLALVCTIPYVLLTAALGKMVWEAYGGHMKASGAIVIIGLFLLPIDKSTLLRFMLAVQAIVGLDVQADIRVMHARILSPHLIHEEAGYEPNPPGAPDNAVLSDLRSTVEWINPQEVMRLEYHGLWTPTQREVRPIAVAVTNHTDVTWQPGRGQHPIWLGYILKNGAGDRQLASHSIIIDKPIAPGETKEFSVPLELWKANRGFTVEFSLRQDGPGWFMHVDPSFGRKYQFRVE